MGKQSARLYFKGKDHKEIYFQGHYHDAMYIGSTLVWQKIGGGEITGKFRFKISTDSTSSKTYFYMQGIALIDWGDGTDIQTVDNSFGNLPTKHKYANKGEYIITIEPQSITWFGFSKYSYTNDFVTEVLDKFPIEMENTRFDYCFYNCITLTKLPEGLFSNCTNWLTCNSLFYNCYNLTEIPEGLFGNCPGVTDFASCFYKCEKLEKLPEGLFSGCADATSFANCFYQCISLTEIPKDLFSKCLKIYSIGSCFLSCYRLSEIPDTLLTADNCQHLADVRYAFSGCSGIVSEVPRLWATAIYPSITAKNYCFKGCTNASNYDSIPSTWK